MLLVEDPLALVEELERRDREIAGALARITELGGRVEALRARAADLEAFFERLPRERDYLAAALAEAEQERAAAREALEAAERALAELGESPRRSPEDVEAAREQVERAAAATVEAEDKLARLRTRRVALDEQADASRAEVAVLEGEALRLAGELRAVPRLSSAGGEDPGPGLAGIAGWAGRAAAALLVVRGGLERERDAAVREANELAASALGEPLLAGGVAAVRERLERERR